MRIRNFLHRFLLHVYYSIILVHVVFQSLSRHPRYKYKASHEKKNLHKKKSQFPPDLHLIWHLIWRGHGMAWSRGPLRLVDVLIRSKGFGGDTNLEPGNPSLVNGVGWLEKSQGWRVFY